MSIDWKKLETRVRRKVSDGKRNPIGYGGDRS